MLLALVSMTHSITILPTEFLTQIEMLSMCTSMPIYLMLVIKGCSFLEKFEQGTQNVLQKRGALFIMCGYQPPLSRWVDGDCGGGDAPD
jgi:hypothetical protein